MTKRELERALHRAKVERDEAQAREQALYEAAQRALVAIDDLALDPFEQRTAAAAILERAIGREPRNCDGRETLR